MAADENGDPSDGNQSILDIVPTDSHQRVPVFVGNRDLVEMAEKMVCGK